MSMPVKSGQIVPALNLPLVGGGNFILGDPEPKNFSVLVFYRGLHCQRCPGQLQSYQTLLPAFQENGTKVISISSDDAQRASKSSAEWGITSLPMAYNFSIEAASDWNLYVTSGSKPEDPDVFTEPALFVINNKGILDIGVINSGPRLRLAAEDVLAHIQDRISTMVAAKAISR